MITLRCIFAAIIGALLAGCGPSHSDRERLERAEAIVREYPDSALSILDSITPKSLQNKQFGASAAIVEAEAAYQQSRLLASDSLLDAAIDFYRVAPDSPRRLRAFYLRGYQNYLAQRYANALVDYLTAEQTAKSLADSITLGLIYRAMGDTYYRIKDYRSSLDNYKLSNDIFKSLDIPKYYPYSELLLGLGYYNAFNYSKSIETLRSLIREKEKMDSIEQATIYSVIAYSFINLNRNAQAQHYVDTIRTFYPGYMSEKFLQNAGHLAFKLKNQKDFAYYREALQRVAPENKWLDYLAACNRNDYRQAHDLLQVEFNQADSVYTSALSNDIRNVAINYSSTRNDYLREKNQQSAFALVWVICISLLIIVCLVIYIVYKRRLQAMVNESHNEFVRQLSETVERYKAEADERSRATFIVNPSQLRLPSRFDALSTLCGTYYSYKATKNIKSKIYDELTDIISSLRLNSPQFIELIDFIDSSQGNIYSQFKTDITTANENDLELFAFIVLGFSSKVIAVIQGITTDQFYARKTYLKKKVATSSPESATKYLAYF